MIDDRSTSAAATSVRPPADDQGAGLIARGPEAPTADRGEGVVEEAEKDDVHEASMQSFPASDPPGWISMRLGPPAALHDPQPARR